MKSITLTSLIVLAALSAPRVQAAPTTTVHDHDSSQAAVKTERKAPESNRFGGPVYAGTPALAVTASLVEAGGGSENFSIAKALTAMGGEELVKAEVEKLTKQYGEEKVKSWLEAFDFAVKDALRMATEAGVKLPKGTLTGKKLASTLVTAGLDKSHRFYTCTMLDKAISHPLHVAAMDNIDKKFGAEADTNYHTITNQAMFDLAQALGMKKVKLSELH